MFFTQRQFLAILVLPKVLISILVFCYEKSMIGLSFFDRSFEGIRFKSDDIVVGGFAVFGLRKRCQSLLDVLDDEFFGGVVEPALFLTQFLFFGEDGDDLAIDYGLAKGLYHIEDQGRLAVVRDVQKRIVDIEPLFDEGRLDAVVEDGVAVVESLIDGVLGVFVRALEVRESGDDAKAVPVVLADLRLESHEGFALFGLFDFGDEFGDLVDGGLDHPIVSPEIEVFEEIELVFGFCVVEVFGISEAVG